MLKIDLPKAIAGITTIVCMVTGDIPVAVGIVLCLLNVSYEIKINIK